MMSRLTSSLSLSGYGITRELRYKYRVFLEYRLTYFTYLDITPFQEKERTIG